jgi:hypothetical protein
MFTTGTSNWWKLICYWKLSTIRHYILWHYHGFFLQYQCMYSHNLYIIPSPKCMKVVVHKMQVFLIIQEFKYIHFNVICSLVSHSESSEWKFWKGNLGPSLATPSVHLLLHKNSEIGQYLRSSPGLSDNFFRHYNLRSFNWLSDVVLGLSDNSEQAFWVTTCCVACLPTVTASSPSWPVQQCLITQLQGSF